jgi:hypothetical protein
VQQVLALPQEFLNLMCAKRYVQCKTVSGCCSCCCCCRPHAERVEALTPEVAVVMMASLGYLLDTLQVRTEQYVCKLFDLMCLYLMPIVAANASGWRVGHLNNTCYGVPLLFGGTGG